MRGTTCIICGKERTRGRFCVTCARAYNRWFSAKHRSIYDQLEWVATRARKMKWEWTVRQPDLDR